MSDFNKKNACNVDLKNDSKLQAKIYINFPQYII
jgi:hypothetical protein